MKVEISNGEVVDKLTILEIKLEQIKDKQKRFNLNLEYDILNQKVEAIISKQHSLYQKLLEINKQLWKIENRIRELERKRSFGPEFIKLARSVYFTNDKRSEIKRQINEQTNSRLIEEKSYENYL